MKKLIHFIWLGELKESVHITIERFKSLNPNYTVLLHHNDESELLSEFKLNYLTHAPLVQMKSDLLRYSILQKYGGWYFDIDCVPFVPLDEIIDYYNLDGSKLFLTRSHIFFNNDILYSGDTSINKYWPIINEYLSKYREPTNKYNYGEYSIHMFRHCFAKMEGGLEQCVIGEKNRFNYTKNIKPFILRGDDVFRNNLIKDMSWFEKLKNYSNARTKWINAGKPLRTEEEIKMIFDTYCKTCPFLENNNCKLCGCNIKRQGVHLNKLAWSTEQCPHNPPFWTSDVK